MGRNVRPRLWAGLCTLYESDGSHVTLAIHGIGDAMCTAHSKPCYVNETRSDLHTVGLTQSEIVGQQSHLKLAA